MSKKPIKKSDGNKEWLASRGRKVVHTKLEYHMIICEGTETEPNYFEGMKKRISEDNRRKVDIRVVGKGRGTISLLNEAIREVRNSTNYISTVWLVYDKDDFVDKDFNEVVKECEKQNALGETIYIPIWSNECFENWILLHFDYFDTAITRDDCIKKLNRIFKDNKWGRYSKSDENIYEKLEPFQETAIENAKKQERLYSNQLLSEMNPCTLVYRLVEFLKKYIKS